MLKLFIYKNPVLINLSLNNGVGKIYYFHTFYFLDNEVDFEKSEQIKSELDHLTSVCKYLNEEQVEIYENGLGFESEIDYIYNYLNKKGIEVKRNVDKVNKLVKRK